jgi:hypothetical protein
MNKHTTVLKCVESQISRHEFQEAVDFFQGDKHTRSFKTKNLFSTMAYGQLAGSYSIRAIENGLRANSQRLYHNGLSQIRRSTFADALNKRDHRIFERLFETVLDKAKLLTGRRRLKFGTPLKIIDATTIEVNVNRFSWAAFRQTKGGMKLHMCYDSDTQLPEQMFFTDAKVHEKRRFSSFAYQEGDVVVFDRAYIDYNSLHRIEINGGVFVTRVKSNACYMEDEVFFENATGSIRRDSRVRFTGYYASRDYPKPLRVIAYYDAEREKFLRFMTNDFTRDAQTIADIYKERWQVELFFKWLKQNLKIKTFWATSKNAVLIQIWVALILYLLLWMLKMQHLVEYSLQAIRQMIQVTLLEKMSIDDLFRPPPLPQKSSSQLYLFEAVS